MDVYALRNNALLCFDANTEGVGLSDDSMASACHALWAPASQKSCGYERNCSQPRSLETQAIGVAEMISSHASALQDKHAGIEAQLRVEMNRPAPNEDTIRELKKRKLRIKEELEAI